MMLSLELFVLVLFQPGNPVHTYPGHMSHYLHNLLLTVESLSKDNVQTLLGHGAIVCPAWVVMFSLLSVTRHERFASLLRKQNGGTNKTPKARHRPPGWT